MEFYESGKVGTLDVYQHVLCTLLKVRLMEFLEIYHKRRWDCVRGTLCLQL